MKLSLENLRSKKIVIYDVSGQFATENNLFDQAIVKEKWYRYSGVYLYNTCLKHGIQLMTPDVYFSLPKKPDSAIVVRDSTAAHYPDNLLKKSGLPFAVLIGSEHPLQACRFFWNLKRKTENFHHSFIMRGAKERISPYSQFHTWFTPHTYLSAVKQVEANFLNKKYLVLINRNTRIHRLRRLYVRMANFVRPLPTFTDREGYLDRLEAIHYFSRDPGFDLYGIGWDKAVRYADGKYDVAIKKSYRGAVDDKFALLKQYKFSLCIENVFFGGCVEEKIIDSLFAGCVPIYWGAPDVTDFIPEDCFIDFRKFNLDYKELEYYLKSIDGKMYQKYIDNINKFIVSEYAYNLSQEKYVKDLIKIFESYF